MRYYIIAGEASGDMHAGNLVHELKKHDHNTVFRGWGGDKMEACGVQIVKHYRELAFMGFVEVARNLKTILSNLEFCKRDIRAFKPDVIILVDYPGFNLRIARFARQLGIKVLYYISPQVWAWKQSRVHEIKHTVDRMYVILPFEKDFYKRFDFDVDYTGHPLLDEIEKIKSEPFDRETWRIKNNIGHKPVVALLPGSRQMEIKKILPAMLEVAGKNPDYEFVVGAASSVPQRLYIDIAGSRDIKMVVNQHYDLLRSSYAALVTSGTATLETALFKVPQVVCYKGNLISYHIAKKLIKVNYISLVNLIMNKEVITELIQNDLTIEKLNKAFLQICNTQTRIEILKEYDALIALLGHAGASAKAASLMFDFLNGKISSSL